MVGTEWATGSFSAVEYHGVARWGVDGFLAVGSGATVIETVGRDLESWSKVTVPSGYTVAPELRGVTRLGDAVVMVGTQGVVWLREADGTWHDLTDDVWGSLTPQTLNGVASDRVHTWFGRKSGGGWTYREDASFVAVGQNGTAVWVELNLEALTFSPDVRHLPSGETSANLYGAYSDLRSRVLVGDGIILVQPIEERFDRSWSWMDRTPPDLVSGAKFRAITSDNLNYVVVGEAPDPDDTDSLPATIAIAYTGLKDIKTCTRVPDLVDLDATIELWDTDCLNEADDTDPFTDTDFHIGPPRQARPLDVGGALADTGRTVSSAGEVTYQYDDTDTDDLEPDGDDADTLPDLPDPFHGLWVTNVVDYRGAEPVHWRVSMVPEQMPVLFSTSPGSRVAFTPMEATTEYDLSNGPAYTGTFVDILTGIQYDPGTPAVLSMTAGAFGAEDVCGFPAYQEATEPDDTDADTLDQPVFYSDTDVVDPEAGVRRFFRFVTRFRSAAVHDFVGEVEAFRDGHESRFQGMNHLWKGRCTKGPFDTGTDERAVCCNPSGSENSASDNWLSLYAPVDGVIYKVEDSVDQFRTDDTIDGGDGFLDVCAGGVAETRDVPTGGLVFISDNGNLVLRYQKVEVCAGQSGSALTPLEVVWDPNASPSTTSVSVDAGQRIAQTSPYHEFNVQVFVNDEADRWRVLSYLDLVPDELYEEVYVDRFGLPARGTRSKRSPTIPLFRRDACPLGVANSSGTAVDRAELVTSCAHDTDWDTADTDDSDASPEQADDTNDTDPPTRTAEPFFQVCLHPDEGTCGVYGD